MTLIELARKLRPYIEKAAQSLDDADALEAVQLYPRWSGNGISYTTGSRVQQDGILYVVLQDHISQGEWKPCDTPSLFARVLIPDPGVIPEWEQPESTNGYGKGDRVKHNGKTWESEYDGNVWEPGVFGWKEVAE